MDQYALLLAATLNAGTVLAIAAQGLLINEKAGIVNLGAEGIMLCAAIAGFATVVNTGNDWIGFAAGMAAGALLATAFSWLVIWLNTHQYPPGPVPYTPLEPPTICSVYILVVRVLLNTKTI